MMYDLLMSLTKDVVVNAIHNVHNVRVPECRIRYGYIQRNVDILK